MDCMLNGHPINLAGMMIGYMGKVGTKKRSTLPYGMVLTLVFRRQSVDILENEPQKKLRHTDCYNISTLHRMGFKKINGQWQRRRQSDVPKPIRGVRVDIDDEEEEVPGPSAPAHGPSAPGPTWTKFFINSTTDNIFWTLLCFFC